MKVKVDKSHVYGELTAPSIVKLAEHMKKHKKQSFLDIGSGYGLITRGIDEYFRETGTFRKVTGIEKDFERFTICNKINFTKEKYKKNYKIIHGDIFNHLYLINEAEYIFSNSLLFEKRFPEKVISHMKPGSIFIHNTMHSNIENKANLVLSSGWTENNHFKIYVKE